MKNSGSPELMAIGAVVAVSLVVAVTVSAGKG
jgi:hypothetical protein